MVPDYYAMLEVAPDADRSAVETALSRKQPFWSSGTRNPKNKHAFQSCLDQVPAIRQALLGDPASRAAYDAELFAARQLDRDRKLDALQKLVRLRAAKGGLTVGDRRTLRDEAVKLGLAPADLDRLAESIPPRPEAPAPADDHEPAPDVLDGVMRRQIRVALDHLGKRDLYDALGVARDAPSQDIALRADAERQRWMRKTQVTAEKTAWLEVVTLAQSHLNAPPARARYDRTLAAEAEEAFAGAVAFALQGLTTLDPGTLEALRDEADALGIAPDRADRIVGRVARKQGAAGALGAATPPRAERAPRLIRCRSCAGVTDHARVATLKGPALCLHCAESLRWSCPVCQRVHWVDEPRCGGCGFRLAFRDPFVRHFEAAQRLFRLREYAGSLSHLRRAQEYAPNHVGARKGVERARERLVEIEKARADWEVAHAERRLVAAKAAARAWGALVQPGAPDWLAAWSATNRLIAQAAALAARARTREGTDPKSARQLYRRSLAVAADLPQALEGLNRCPPDPPTELVAEFVEGRVALRWAPPPADGLGPVTYVVRRKAEAPFKHPNEGALIAETTEHEYSDEGVAAGTSVSYAVLARRGDATSVGAVAFGPIFLMADVKDVRVETRAREVDLSWTPPRGAAEVRVVRKRGSAPNGPQDGERVESLLDHARDAGLETDRVYFYGIYAVYRDNQGRAGASKGVVVSAQPHTPVAVLAAPTVAPEPDGRARITWVEPSRGIVKLLRATGPFPHPPGARLSPSQVAAVEGEWVEVTAPDHAVDAPPPGAPCHYTPMVSWAGTLTVGHSAAIAAVEDPSDLRSWRLGNGRVNLRWTWGPVGGETVVVLKSSAPPTGPDDPDAFTSTVTEADYVREGLFAVALPEDAPGPWHVAVYALARVDGRRHLSPGTEPTARTVVGGTNPELTLSYAFRRKGLTGRSWSLTFRTEPAGAEVPPTVLVGRARAVPLDADDGEVIARFPAARDGQKFDLPKGAHPLRTHARAFIDPLAAADAAGPVTIRHPETGAARV